MLRTVLVHGVFDLLHIGHIEHLEKARSMGDRLVISVTADKYISKGPGRPVYTLAKRMRMLAALSIVDEVIRCDDPTAIPSIKKIKPALYVKGSEYKDRKVTGKLELEKATVERYGGRLAFTDGETMSSSAIVNEHMPQVSEQASRWLQDFKTRYTSDDVIAWLEMAGGLSVNCFGENILDRYIYVTPRGRSAKSSVVVWQTDGQDEWLGGVNAVAGHAKAVTTNVWVNTTDVLAKTRHVERPFLHTVHSYVNQEQVSPLNCGYHRRDLFIVADFGHGLIPNAVAADQILAVKGVKYALTVQANSLNWGLNTARKWRRADYMVLDWAEWELALEDRSIEYALLTAHLKWDCDTWVVTRGHEGCIVYRRNPNAQTDKVVVPALSGNVVDRLGTGDAFLAITSPLAAINAPIEIIGFVGNIAGAIHCGVIGNSAYITKAQLRGWIKGLMA